MTQTWHALLFAHWPCSPALLAKVLPPPIDLDLHNGLAWVGIVPFLMTNVTLRGVSAIPWLSTFEELNVRTYVRVDDKPGVYFFSLDAARLIAVASARLLGLPYHWASMQVTRKGDDVRYASRRRSFTNATFVATYRPTGPAFSPVRGSLEYFLTERYCLYACDVRKRPYRLDIHHSRWQLQTAEATIVENNLTRAAGLDLPAATPLLHFARRQDVVAWAPEHIAGQSRLNDPESALGVR